MSEVIWKFQLHITDEQVVAMPMGAAVLYVGMQNETLCLWAKVDPEAELEDRHILIYGTGDRVVPDCDVYLGTFITMSDRFVGHVHRRRLA